ncbi:MAG TPA: hypothetical protein VGH72_33680 [Pseudonocardia sp.]
MIGNDLRHEPVDEDRQAHSQEAHVGAHSDNRDQDDGNGGQRDRGDRAGRLVVALEVLTAPDVEVYKERREPHVCAWIECTEQVPGRLCAKHLAWRAARSQVKTRLALFVRVMADELAARGYPVAS